ncbi:MAG: dihydrofolate reductase family protein [Candidatus Aenigmatarchaeota archaeon]
MLKNDEFNRSNLNKIRTIVVTKNQIKIHDPEFVSTAKSPREAIEILKKGGFKTIMVCGGGKLNSSFMEENLIDEIYIDIEPIVFGKGIRIFESLDFEAKLKLLEVKKISKNEIQLHYEVFKD